MRKGKCINQVVGSWPYLNLQNAANYTGYDFRTNSGTLLAN